MQIQVVCCHPLTDSCDHALFRTVARYVDILKQVDGLILCFPHWWFSMPAMLKGWVDRVWGPGTAFVYDPNDGHLRPNLHNIKLFGVVTSYGSSWWIVRVFAGDAGLAGGLPSWSPDMRATKLPIIGNQPAPPAFLRRGRAIMWCKWLISFGLLAIVLTACDPQLLIAKLDPSDYEVVALIAQ